MSEIKLGKYRHFKGKDYEVLFVGKHTETLEDVVIYRALYGDYGIWVRPLKMFTEKVIVDDKLIERFKYIGDK